MKEFFNLKELSFLNLVQARLFSRPRDSVGGERIDKKRLVLIRVAKHLDEVSRGACEVIAEI